MIAFISLYLISLCVNVFANLDRELRISIDTAMKCQYRDPPQGPVIAVTPSRFSQIVAILHQKFSTPSCFIPSKVPISADDESSWPFCIFGICIEDGRCKCAGHFGGSKCHIYKKKCWLMYCYLTSCHPAHQSLHCICDPRLYRTKVLTGIYWYDEGRSSVYKTPPPGWEDEPISWINFKNNGTLNVDSNDTQKNVAGKPIASNDFGSGFFQQDQNSRYQGETQSMLAPISQIPKPNTFSEQGRPADGRVTQKSDVENALDQLEDVSSAQRLKAARMVLIIVLFITLCIC